MQESNLSLERTLIGSDAEGISASAAQRCRTQVDFWER